MSNVEILQLADFQVLAVLPFIAKALIGAAIGHGANELTKGGSNSAQNRSLQSQLKVGEAEAAQIEQRTKLAAFLEDLIKRSVAFNPGETPFRLPKKLGEESNLQEVLSGINFGDQRQIDLLMGLLGSTGSGAGTVNQLGAQAHQNANKRQDSLSGFVDDIVFSLLSGSFSPKSNPSSSTSSLATPSSRILGGL